MLDWSELKGINLFDRKHQVIAHGCNAQGVMGSGFAKELKEHFPESYNQYHKYCTRFSTLHKEILLGTVSWCHENDTYIANCITQKNYGQDGKRYASYDAIYDSLTEVKRLMLFNNLTSISMPMIGCGLGGCNRKIVMSIMEEIFYREFNVQIYEL